MMSRPTTWIPLLVAPSLLAAGSGLASASLPFTPSQIGHWGWKKPARPAVPKVKNRAWVVNPVDAFILAGLEARGLKPAPTASRETLIRRVALDLTGLPPTLAEIDAFLADLAPGAYERMVDRYLASPHYGERWARHWLDLARYADTNGYEHDEIRPDAWRYRDYVVRAFNSDKPYDRFVQEQIAGDELDPKNAEARTATAFNLLGPDMTDSADQAVRRQNTLNDMTDTTGLVFLGLTLGCARCHDHKYEPLLQADYYRLQAFFAPARFRTDLPAGSPEEEQEYQRRRAEHQGRLASLRKQMEETGGTALAAARRQAMARLPEDIRTAFATPVDARTADQQKLVENNQERVEPDAGAVAGRLTEPARSRYEELARELKALLASKPIPPRTMGLAVEGMPPATHVLERGELHNRGPEVQPGYPSILAASASARTAASMGATGRRLTLAHWITRPDHPLTARVMVNRVWQHHFGRGIVPTPSDFGVRGVSPTHPELLDYLAVAFATEAGGAGSRLGSAAGPQYAIRHATYASPVTRQRSSDPGRGLGWSVKALHRLILTSNAYKQSSRPSPGALKADPENELFSRMNRLRLEAEAVRDAALAVSGRLNLKMGGPGVFPPVPVDAAIKGAVWPVSKDPADHTRRSLYVFVRRNLSYPSFEVFDAPDTNLSCPVREVSTTAPQALTLLNDPEMLQTARYLAGRLVREARTDAERIRLAYRLVLTRSPAPAEVRTGEEFLRKLGELLQGRDSGAVAYPLPRDRATDARAGAALTDYCLALLNLNEYLYVD